MKVKLFKDLIIFLISGCLIASVILLAWLVYYKDNVKFDVFGGDVIYPQINYELNGIKEIENNFVTINNDPQMIFKLNKSRNVKNISLLFNEEVSENIPIQIFYSEDRKFSEDKSIRKVFERGNCKMSIPLSDANCKYLRIDFGNDKYIKYNLKEISISNNNELVNTLNIYNWISTFIVLSALISIVIFKIFNNIKLLLNKQILYKSLILLDISSLFIIIYYLQSFDYKKACLYGACIFILTCAVIFELWLYKQRKNEVLHYE